MKTIHTAKSIILIILIAALIICCKNENKAANEQSIYSQRDSTQIDREYTLEASMLGYFAKDGTRNPTLQANKGDRVRIVIVNRETMTHDIALENIDTKSKTIFEKGSSTSLTFWAEKNDTYYCTVPGHRTAGMVGEFEIVEGNISNAVIAGIVPKKEGRPLNLGFERGDLSDWTTKGTSFKNAPYYNSKSIYQKDDQIAFDGDFFLSSGGDLNYKLKGSLTSVPFKITHPFASFKISGGALADTRVELILEENKEVIFKSTGQGNSVMQPVVIDLSNYLKKEIFIRIIDNETGASPISYISDDKSSYINFDNFRFYHSRPNFPNELKQEDIIILPPIDPILNSGLSGTKAAQAMTLPEDFTIKLAASEPDIVRPISFTIDARGRLWVVEGHTYPVPAEEGKGKDRILIFEDTNGDGVLNKKNVFADGLNLVSGIEVGMGGVWLGAAPYLLFIPIDEATDKPAGPPQKLLDGWGVQDTHEVLNNLRWGPDGWLYGVHGVFTHSNVGKPGSPDEERTKLNAAVWRYHPTRHEFEIFSEGTSNPWGIDFNDYGHAFTTVCVIPHMYHVIQGARYQRQYGEHFNPYTYDDIKTIADHVHYLGDRGPHAGNFRSAAAGGGHAHAGAMIYLGGDTWPKEYHNTIFINNINGARLNNDILTRSGSGYIASHNEDFLVMNDSWSQWLNFKYDPSGSVFAIDWYDQNQCHSPNPDVHDKTLGRIFKISHKNDKWVQLDLSKASDTELINYQLHQNEWFVRQARTILQERGSNPKVHEELKKILNTNPDVTRKLRALWTLHATNGLKENELRDLLKNSNEYIRSWAIQLLTEDKNVEQETIERFQSLAKNDNSALVRLYLTSGIMRLKPEIRWETIEALVKHAEDTNDHNLPLMLWYAAEPLAELNPERLLQIAEKAKTPKFLEYTIQRLGALNTIESKKLLQDLRKRLDREDPDKIALYLKAIDSIL